MPRVVIDPAVPDRQALDNEIARCSLFAISAQHGCRACRYEFHVAA
jgi:hypothetical protein